MFVPVDFSFESNMFAFIDGTLAQKKDTGYSSWRWQKGSYTEYEMQAYWISAAANTRGALCMGTVSMTFNNDFASQINGRSDFIRLTQDEVLSMADTLKVKVDGVQHMVKDISKSAVALFGHRSVWTSGIHDETYRALVETFFTLPAAPQGSLGWVKRVRG
jgi:hypothetical protein